MKTWHVISCAYTDGGESIVVTSRDMMCRIDELTQLCMYRMQSKVLLVRCSMNFSSFSMRPAAQRCVDTEDKANQHLNSDFSHEYQSQPYILERGEAGGKQHLI